MGWARFDDQYSDHPKVIQAGALAELLDMRAVIYCARYETDGWLSREALGRLGAGIPSVVRKAHTLVDVGRWHAKDHACDECPEVFGDGFYVHAFLSYNPTSEAKEVERAAARERMRKARSSKRAPRSSPEQPPNVLENIDRSSRNPVPVPDPNSNSSPHKSHDAPPDPVDDENIRIEATARAALTRIVDQRLGKHPTNGSNPEAHRRTIENDVQREHGARARTIIARHRPDASLDSIVGALLGEPNSLHLYRHERTA